MKDNRLIPVYSPDAVTISADGTEWTIVAKDGTEHQIQTREMSER
jgi:hypothetical protein